MSGTRGHLAPFREGPGPWLVLARNAIPALGVYFFGWTAGEVFLQVWFEGVSALAVMLAFQVRVFASRDEKLYEDYPAVFPAWSKPGLPVFLWAAFVALLGIPYWFVLLIFGGMTDGGIISFFAAGRGIAVALLAALIANIAEEAARGYGRMTNAEIQGEFHWYFSMHLARICVIITCSLMLRAGLIIPLLLGLSYVEIYPLRVLRFLDPSLLRGRDYGERGKD